MSDQGSESDKSELPTHFRLQQARRKGQVARGHDLGFLTGLAAFCAYVWFFGEGVMGELGNVARSAIAAAPGVAPSSYGMLTVAGLVLASAARPLMQMIAAVFVVVLVFEVIQTGPVFSAEPMKLDFNRLNPAQGLKRLFSLRLLIETGKNVLKMAVYGWLGWMAVRSAMAAGTPVATDAASLAGGLRHDAFRLLGYFLAAAAGFAVLDQLIARRDFTKRMRMSRRDVRRESRDREGDPRLKQKRKQLHREFVKAAESLRGVRGADVLITNPTHFAVALKYDPRTMHAPRVVSRGAHGLALRLRRTAFLYGVVIVREPALARALFRCEINQPVPEALFRPVADVYRNLRDRKPAKAGTPPPQEGASSGGASMEYARV
jgi:flagellar biosynthetic protein FlhB